MHLFQHERANVYSISYFGSLIRFAHFIIMVGEALLSLPPLTARHWSLSLRILNNLRLSWKTELSWKFFHCVEIFFTINRIFEQLCACPKKQSLPWNFSLYWICFSHSGFLSNLCLPWKTEIALKSLYWIYIFYHSEFWTTCACLEKQSLPWNFSNSLHWNILYLWGFLSN